MSEDVGILIFIGGGFLAVVLMIVVGARFASRFRPGGPGDVVHRATDDDDDGSWRRSTISDTVAYSTLGAVALGDGEPGDPEDERNDDQDSGGGDDGGWDSSDSSSDSSDSGGGDSSD